jgi:hypothetical protein
MHPRPLRLASLSLILTALGALAPGPVRSARADTLPVLRVEVRAEGFTPVDRSKLEAAVALLERTVNRAEFRERVSGFEWDGERRFAENRGLTNPEILETLLAAEERWSPGADSTIQLQLLLYRSRNPWSSVPGWTRASDPVIRINARFFRSPDWTPADVAGNLAHEWLHQLGFTHARDATPERPFTVPYAVGEIVRLLAAEERPSE